MNNDLLRPLGPDDLELVRTWRNSPAVAQYMYTADPISAEQQQAWYARISHDATVQYWLIYHQSRPVGVANLYAISSSANFVVNAFSNDTAVARTTKFALRGYWPVNPTQ